MKRNHLRKKKMIRPKMQATGKEVFLHSSNLKNKIERAKCKRDKRLKDPRVLNIKQ